VPPAIASVVVAVGIVGLFILDRDRRSSHTSKALGIPVVWLLIAGSRPVSLWLQPGSRVTSADGFNVEGNPVNTVVFSALLAVGLIVLVSRGRQIGKLLQANWPMLLFFSYCALSTIWSEYPGAGFRKWIRSTGDPVMVLIVLTDSEPAAALKRLLARTSFLLLPLSVLLIKYYPILGRAYSNGWELMYTGVAQHKNTLGMTCLVLCLGFLWRFIEDYRTKGKPHWRRHLLADGAILATGVWLLWTANSATSLSCFLMMTALIAVTSLSRRDRKLAVVHLIVATLISLSLYALFFDAGGGLVESVGRNPTLTGRTGVWRQVLALAGNPWFGVGFESFWLGTRLQTMWNNNVGFLVNQAHNGYIEVYLNLGWCGITLLAVLIVTGYRNVIIAFRRDGQLGRLKLAYFVAAVIYSLTEAGFRMASPIWIFFLLATTAVPKPSARLAPTLGKQVTPSSCRVPECEGVS